MKKIAVYKDGDFLGYTTGESFAVWNAIRVEIVPVDGENTEVHYTTKEGEQKRREMDEAWKHITEGK